MTSLAGRVTVHGGSKPATTATVELRDADGDRLDQIRVDDQGGFRYHVAPGTWTLNVWDAHGHRGTAEVEVGEGEDRTLDVDLDEPEGGH